MDALWVGFDSIHFLSQIEQYKSSNGQIKRKDIKKIIKELSSNVPSHFFLIDSIPNSVQRCNLIHYICKYQKDKETGLFIVSSAAVSLLAANLNYGIVVEKISPQSARVSLYLKTVHKYQNVISVNTNLAHEIIKTIGVFKVYPLIN